MVRVYTDMTGDLFHYGHVNALRQCKEYGDVLIVGVHSNKSVESYKRTPIMNMDERIKVIEACKYVDEIVREAPTVITEEYIKKHNIDIVCITDTRPDEQNREFYSIPMDLGIVKTFKYTNTISTTDIIKKIKNMY